MIDKILIAEDHESINISVQRTLEELAIKRTDYVYYCDDAVLQINNSVVANDPFDLLITDLYFDEDHRLQKIKDGIELIAAARKIQPSLKVLVFSAEARISIIEKLINDYDIDGFVRKARHDSRQIKLAIEAIASNRKYMSYMPEGNNTHKNSYQFSELDVMIISMLAKGVLQKNIPDEMIRNKVERCGLSTVEKRLNRMKDSLEFSKNEQLIAFCKDMGVI